MRAIIFENLPIFFIIACIWLNLFSIVFNSVTLTPLPGLKATAVSDDNPGKAGADIPAADFS